MNILRIVDSWLPANLEPNKRTFAAVTILVLGVVVLIQIAITLYILIRLALFGDPG